MSALKGSRRGRLRRVRSIGVATVLVVIGLMWIGSAQAVHDNGMFELDGNTVNNGSAVYDWNNLFDANGNRVAPTDPINGPLLDDTFVSDAATPDQSYFTSNKDIQPIASGQQHWGCSPLNNPLAKDDLLNAYAAVVQVPANAPDNAGDQVLYMGSERGSNNGTSFAGFWLLKDPTVGCSGSNDFSGQHEDGDLLIISDYTNGGGTQDVSVYRWTGDDATGQPVLDASFNGSICSNSLSNDNSCAIANGSTITTPWSPTSHDSNTFVETGIDLTALLGSSGGCFTNFMAETRSSDVLTATLKDFAGGSLNTCVPPVIDTTATPGGSTVALGATNQHDVATVSKVDNRPDPTGTVSFFLCNPSQVTAGGCESGGTQVGSAVTIANGSATSDNAGGSLINAAGKYCWRAEYAPDSDGSKFYVAGSHTNSTTECFTVIPNSPTIVTNATTQGGNVVGTGTTCDSATLAGSFNGTGTITFKLTAPDSTVTTLPDVTVAGDGTYNSPSCPLMTQVGTYTWSATYSGDTLNNGAVDNGQNESVTSIKASPSIATQASVTGNGVVGTDSTSDTATISGGDDPQGSIQFSITDPNGITTQVGGLVPVDGDGTYNAPSSVPLTLVGTYTWSASYTGDDLNNGAVDNGENESVTSIKASPSIVTTQDPASGAVGDTFKDKATLSGSFDQDGTGSITWTLYPNNDCSGTPLGTDMVSVDDNGTFETPTGVKVDSAGTYYWVASFSGDSNNNKVSSGCADEPVVVKGASVHILKTADAAKVNVGSPIGFTMTVSNTGDGDAHGVQLTDPLPAKAGLAWSVASTGTGWGSPCTIDSSNVLHCGGANGVTVPAGTTQAASTFTVHVVAATTAPAGGDCPGSGEVDNTGHVTSSNDGSDQSTASTCVQALVDLSVTKAGSPATQELGQGNITWTIVVTNNGPDADTGVTITDPMPAGNTFVSATTSKGSCTGGGVLTCAIGPMAVGEQVTITLVTTPSAAGTQTNTVNVSGNRPETNTGNNSASASVVVTAPITPPVKPCIAVSKVTPKQLFVGRKTKLTIHVTQGGKAVKGIHVRIKGAKINLKTKASSSKGVIKQTLKMKKAGVLVFTPIASKACNTKRVGVTNVFTPPVTG